MRATSGTAFWNATRVKNTSFGSFSTWRIWSGRLNASFGSDSRAITPRSRRRVWPVPGFRSRGGPPFLVSRRPIIHSQKRLVYGIPYWYFGRAMRLAVFLALAGLALLPVSSTAQQAKPGPAPEFATDVSPYLDRHCVRCHGQEKQKGDLRIDTLERDFSKSAVASRWMDIMERINSGEMPPKKEPRPKPAEGARVSEWISAQLIEAEASRESSTTGSVSFHRLTRDEYRRSIHDLLGVTFDATDPTG